VEDIKLVYWWTAKVLDAFFLRIPYLGIENYLEVSFLDEIYYFSVGVSNTSELMALMLA
jgi:hypothetical protein